VDYVYDQAAGIEERGMRRKNLPVMGFYTMAVAGIILAGFFLLVISGARAYRSTVAGQERNNRDRALLSYVSASVKAGDAENAVSVYYVDGAPVVAVEEEGSGYGIRIYQYQGKLMGDYGWLEGELDPEEALVVGETEIFQVEDLGNDTYAVTTDAGRVLFHVRSSQTAAQPGQDL